MCADHGFIRRPLTTTVWKRSSSTTVRHETALVTVGMTQGCHVVDKESFIENWMYSVYRTDDSLVVLNMSPYEKLTVYWGKGEFLSIELVTNGVLRVPMLRHPVLITTRTSLVTVTPSEYAPVTPSVHAPSVMTEEFENYLLTSSVTLPDNFLPGDTTMFGPCRIRRQHHQRRL